MNIHWFYILWEVFQKIIPWIKVFIYAFNSFMKPSILGAFHKMLTLELVNISIYIHLQQAVS